MVQGMTRADSTVSSLGPASAQQSPNASSCKTFLVHVWTISAALSVANVRMKPTHIM